MDLDMLCRSPLFEGIAPQDAEKLIGCLHGRLRTFDAGSFVWHAGDAVSAAAVILKGRVRAERVTPEGELRIAAVHGPGSLVGDILMTEARKSPVDVYVTEACELLFLPFEPLMEGCGKCCECHSRLRLNLLQEIARKYWQQRSRIACLEASGLRQKILVYLRACAKDAGADTFRIPLDRQGMADWLAVNRSALCRELGAMKREGLLDYYKDSFRLFV